MLSVGQAASSTIFWVFGMTRPRIEPWSTRPLVNTLLIRPMARCTCIYIYIYIYIYIWICKPLSPGSLFTCLDFSLTSLKKGTSHINSGSSFDLPLHTRTTAVINISRDENRLKYAILNLKTDDENPKDQLYKCSAEGPVNWIFKHVVSIIKKIKNKKKTIKQSCKFDELFGIRSSEFCQAKWGWYFNFRI